MRLTLALIPAALLALSACDKSEQPSTDGNTVATDIPAEATATGATAADAMPETAQAFVDAAGASDMFEIESSKLARTMGKDPGVKSFAEMMVTDHTQSTADLKAAAAKADGVTVYPQLTPKQQSDLDALKNAGDNFDSVYKTQQLAAHQQALSLLQNYASAGDQQALKDFASNTATVVQTHLEHAQMLP